MREYSGKSVAEASCVEPDARHSIPIRRFLRRFAADGATRRPCHLAQAQRTPCGGRPSADMRRKA
jgi:hypothetical protein